jgi:hypothetical protein
VTHAFAEGCATALLVVLKVEPKSCFQRFIAANKRASSSGEIEAHNSNASVSVKGRADNFSRHAAVVNLKQGD